MFYFLAPFLAEFWGPFRLLGSHFFLIAMSSVTAFIVALGLLPAFWRHLPVDRGRAHTPTPGIARGKPTGAGLVLMICLLPVLFVYQPFSARLWEIMGCIFLAMMTGYLDDRSPTSWGEYRKGILDLAIAALASLAMCQGKPMVVWLPVIKLAIVVPPLAYVIGATVLLWLTINATNCSDGVDGLAGALTLLELLYLGVFLYLAVGHAGIADYLLLPHNPEGAKWAILLFATSGILAGYLWHNAEPSRVLMGDAGSRFLGLLVGVSVLATGNPVLIVVIAPVVLINGGTGIVKVALLRALGRVGFDSTPVPRLIGETNSLSAARGNDRRLSVIVRFLHRIRFPLHDHCRKNLGWSNAQVLMRFVLIQALLTPLLLVLLVKVR